ncbi:ABC transporter ATP-binding protein [Planococcus shenhongbingii]|uniref:ABC transporter ATP-binding protein n=1 Tax=Planococcus shenhongbingii TaxID=3058398 RepID=A0ABT8NGY3_9BACL|nr:ABC transporter ATP-binding protein [Planococcus sp. N017]MDN7246740.1 ABC transporter ATP-binding protein [Planococcus sp. N017]
MKKIIQTEHLSKHYQKIRAVDNVSLEVAEGEIYGFIGLNGSGKTTTIRMLLGLIRPTHGRCFLNSQQVKLSNFSLWEKVGYMVETPYAYPELTVKENLDIFCRLRRISDPMAILRVMDHLKLAAYADKKAKHLSLGNAQRLGIAKALLHNPDILILDEPVNGLDPAGIVEVRELLQHLAVNENKTIFISSHLLDEVAKIATKIGIIHEGCLLQEVESARLSRLLKQRLLLDSRHKKLAISALSEAGTNCFLNEEGLIESYDQSAIQNPDNIARLLVNKGCPPTRLVVEEENLESYFLRAIGKKGEGGSE